MFAEMLFEHRIEGSEVARIIEPNPATDYVFWTIAGFLKDRQKILYGLFGLHTNIANYYFAIDHWNLA